MLLTDRRRAFGRPEDDGERDAWQGSLFAPDALAPPAKPPGPTPDPFAWPPRTVDAPPPEAGAAPVEVAEPDHAVPPAEALVPPAEVAAPDFAAPPGYDDDEPADLLDAPEEPQPAHARVAAPRSILTGPTLDDVMSRVWEGLRAEVPTPCPVCHAEIEPSAHGRCDACGTTLA